VYKVLFSPNGGGGVRLQHHSGSLKVKEVKIKENRKREKVGEKDKKEVREYTGQKREMGS